MRIFRLHLIAHIPLLRYNKRLHLLGNFLKIGQFPCSATERSSLDKKSDSLPFSRCYFRTCLFHRVGRGNLYGALYLSFSRGLARHIYISPYYLCIRPVYMRFLLPCRTPSNNIFLVLDT